MAEKPSSNINLDAYKTLSERGWFKDRDDLIEIYFSSLNATRRNSLQLLVYYGLGGLGKTALCEELIKRTGGPWNDDTIIGHLDLHERDQLSGEWPLLWIRNALAAESRLKFPAFDLAFTMYWKKTRPEKPLPDFVRHGWLSSSSEFGEEAGIELFDDLVSDLAEAATEGAVKSVPLAAAAREVWRFGTNQLNRYRLVRSNPDVRDLVQPENGRQSASHLFSRLPILLGNDLRRSLEENDRRRFVLLIDEYEKVFEEGGASTSLAPHAFDDTVRTFISRLDKTLVVIFSRERLPWANKPPIGENAEAWAKWIKKSHQPIEGLVKSDARNLLRDAGIADEALIAAIFEGAQIVGDNAESRVYPLMLELQIYHYEAISRDGRHAAPEDFRTDEASHEALRRRLVERFIRNYRTETQTLIKLLAVPRWFNREVFEALRDLLPRGESLGQFRIISGLAFVQRQAEERLTFPKTIRESLLLLSDEEVIREARQALWRFYRRKTEEFVPGTPMSIEPAREAMHHGLAVDTMEALSWWRDIGDSYVETGQITLSVLIEEQIVQGLEPFQPAFRLDLIDALSELSASYGLLDRPRAAIRMIRRTLALRRQTVSPNSPSLIGPILRLADLYRSEDQFIESDILTDEALDIAELQSKGAPSLEKARVLAIAAQNLEERGLLVQSEPLRRIVLQTTRAVLLHTATLHFEALANLMINLLHQKQFSDAKTVGTEFIEAAELEDYPSVYMLSLFSKSISFWAATPEHVFLNEFATRGVKVYEKRFGSTATAELEFEFAKGRLLFTLLLHFAGRRDEAIKLGELAIDHIRSDNRYGKEARVEALTCLAVLYSLVGELEKGKAALRESEAMVPLMEDTTHDLQSLLRHAQFGLTGLEALIETTQTTDEQSQAEFYNQLATEFHSTLRRADPGQRLQLMRASINQIDQQFGSLSNEARGQRIRWAHLFFMYGQFSDAATCARDGLAILEQQFSNDAGWFEDKLSGMITLAVSLASSDQEEEFQKEYLRFSHFIETTPGVKATAEDWALMRIADSRMMDASSETVFSSLLEAYADLVKALADSIPLMDKLAEALNVVRRYIHSGDVSLIETEVVLTAVEHVPLLPLVILNLKSIASLMNIQEGNHARAIQLKEEIVNILFVTGGANATRSNLIELAELCRQAGRHGEAHKWRKKALRNFPIDSPEAVRFWAVQAPYLATEFIRQRQPETAQTLLEQFLATPTSLLPALSPHRWDARRRLIQALIELKQIEGAQQAVETLSRDMSESEEASVSWKMVIENLGAEVALARGAFTAALTHTTSAIALMAESEPDPGWLRSETLLTNLRVSVRNDVHSVTPAKIEQIISAYKDYHEYPAFIDLLTDIALLEIQAKQPSEGCGHLEQAVELSAKIWGTDSPSHLYLQDLLANLKVDPDNPELVAERRDQERLQRATAHLAPFGSTNWPLPTSLRDDWAYLDQDQLIELITRVITTQQQNGEVILPERYKVRAARSLGLEFYREASLIEVLVEDTAGHKGHFGIVQHQDQLTVLGGSSDPIYDLNLTSLTNASDQNVQLAYFRFFSSWIRDAEKPFLVVERLKDAPPALKGKEAEAQALAKKLKRITSVKSKGEKARVYSAVCVNDGVPSRIRFSINPNSSIRFYETEALTTEPLFMSWRIRNGARFLATENLS